MKHNKKIVFIIIGVVSIIIILFVLLFFVILPNQKYNKFKKYIKNNKDFEYVSKNVYRDKTLSQYDIKYDFNKNTYTRINKSEDDDWYTVTKVKILEKTIDHYLYNKEIEKEYVCHFMMNYSEDELMYEIEDTEYCYNLLSGFPFMKDRELLYMEVTVSHMFDNVKDSKSGLYDNCKYCNE